MELADLEFGKRTLVFRQYTGAVLDTSKWSETHVSGGGGGGMSFHGGQGKTAPVSIGSSTSTQHDIWIKDEETGKDRPIQLSGVDMPLRTGHRITVISVAERRDGKEPGDWWYAMVVNHDAGRFWPVNRGVFLTDQAGLGGTAGRKVLYTLALIVSIVFGGCSLFVAQGPGEGSADFGLYFVFAAAALGFSLWKVMKIPKPELIDRHLSELGRAVLRQGAAAGDGA